MKIPVTVFGMVARFLNLFIPVKSKHWVFGADYGMTYREGSKYLIEYMLEKHPEYDCTFITRNPVVFNELKKKGIPVALNYSFRGIYKALVADSVFTTQTIADVDFTYKKKGRSFYYLVHGQPFKVAMAMLPKQYISDLQSPTCSKYRKTILNLKTKICNYINTGYTHKDVSFVSATSEFTAQLLQREWPAVEVKTIGMPRNDGLFQPERQKREKWLKDIGGKTVITYMPTHRKYGMGDASPIPFEDNKEVQEWMRQNNIVFLVKQHPNMVAKLDNNEKRQKDVIIDISNLGYDPQVVIYHTDILITDYSSVWMDFLLLKRPLIFYFYDEFETNDVGCYYDLRNEFPNNYCDSENGLYQMIQHAIRTPTDLIPSETEIAKFHRYVDGNSCERYFNVITGRI